MGALSPYLLGKNRPYLGQRLFQSGMCPDLRLEMLSLSFLTPGKVVTWGRGGPEQQCPQPGTCRKTSMRVGPLCDCFGDFSQALASAWVPVKGRDRPGFYFCRFPAGASHSFQRDAPTSK